VAASIELRALNIEDTLHNARVIADALQKLHPDSDPSALYDRSLIAIEMASATTRFALALPEPHRARVLLSLKAAISLLIDPVTLSGDAALLSAKRRARRAGAAENTKRNKKAVPVKTSSSSRRR
jgi:hypothetical protein